LALLHRFSQPLHGSMLQQLAGKQSHDVSCRRKHALGTFLEDVLRITRYNHQINDHKKMATAPVQPDVHLRSKGGIGHDHHVQPKNVGSNLIQRPCPAQGMFTAGPRFERAGGDSKAHPIFREEAV
jgi:hypothetical protein